MILVLSPSEAMAVSDLPHPVDRPRRRHLFPAASSLRTTPCRRHPEHPGCVKIFNGQNFDGWEADSSTWSIEGVATVMRGVGGSSRLAYTKTDSRQLPPHLRLPA